MLNLAGRSVVDIRSAAYRIGDSTVVAEQEQLPGRRRFQSPGRAEMKFRHAEYQIGGFYQLGCDFLAAMFDNIGPKLPGGCDGFLCGPKAVGGCHPGGNRSKSAFTKLVDGAL